MLTSWFPLYMRKDNKPSLKKRYIIIGNIISNKLRPLINANKYINVLTLKEQETKIKAQE